MNIDSIKRHDSKIDELIEKYTASGYITIKEPSKNDIPFDLGNYRPDLIAKKGDGGFVIEVKTSASRMQLEKFQEIANEIASHPNWRFLLVTLEDIASNSIPESLDQLPNWNDLQSKLQKAKALLAMDANDALLLYLWSAFEAALRRRAIEIHLPAERLPASQLLKYMYSCGEISVNTIDLVNIFMQQRNKVAHGMSEQLSVQDMTQYIEMVANLINEWADASNHKF